jgi:hypothetical protein
VTKIVWSFGDRRCEDIRREDCRSGSGPSSAVDGAPDPAPVPGTSEQSPIGTYPELRYLVPVRRRGRKWVVEAGHLLGQAVEQVEQEVLVSAGYLR